MAENSKNEIYTADALFRSRREPIVALAARHHLPTMYFARDFVASGGLICYTNSNLDANRQCGVYTGRILNGEKPADLPVQAPTKYELVINLIQQSEIILADQYVMPGLAMG